VGFDSSKTLEENDFDLATALRWDLGAVLEVDAVAVLSGWEHSEGCSIELIVARAISIPVLDADTLEEIKPQAA
jgi:hypothetical protein